jgi:hypothetical protein
MISGKIILYGIHKDKTIEEVFFIDYSWINYMINRKKASWLVDYVRSLPKIFPSKILVKCGSNHHAGCKERTAFRASFPIDYMGKPSISLAEAYYWCENCDASSAGANSGIISYPLSFESIITLEDQLARRSDIKEFHAVLRNAYGVTSPFKKSAFKVFWGFDPL